jgi:hypothetical protein
MVARTLREGELLLVFSRPGELDDIRLAPDGFRAAATAITMIAARTVLQAGDILMVRPADDDRTGEPTAFDPRPPPTD